MKFTPSTWRLKLTKINPKKQSYGQNLPGNGDASNQKRKNLPQVESRMNQVLTDVRTQEDGRLQR